MLQSRYSYTHICSLIRVNACLLELIVHPLLPSAASSASPIPSPPIDTAIHAIIDRCHMIVIGPGLGRDPKTLECVAGVMRYCRRQGKPMVLDADGLHLVSTPEGVSLVGGYKQAVLTPNRAEFGRLCGALVRHAYFVFAYSRAISISHVCLFIAILHEMEIDASFHEMEINANFHKMENASFHEMDIDTT